MSATRPASGRHPRRPDRRLQRFPRRRNPRDEMRHLKTSRIMSPTHTGKRSLAATSPRHSGRGRGCVARNRSGCQHLGIRRPNRVAGAGRVGAVFTGHIHRRGKVRRTRWEGYRVRLSRGGSKARLRDGIAPISRALPQKVQSPTGKIRSPLQPAASGWIASSARVDPAAGPDQAFVKPFLLS